MDISFDVRVIDADGNGVEGAEVSVDYAYGIAKNRTDGDGWARFMKHQAFGEAVQTTIYVNGEIKAEAVWIEDGNTFFFTL